MERGIRLDKLLADAGEASRRRAKDLIHRGRVTVDGQTVTAPGRRVDPEREVRVDGRLISLETRRIYLMLHKPSGYITSTDDPEGRRTVMDLLPAELPRVFPVGRLDYHSCGLLFLTNDGDWANRVAHPRAGVSRVYEIWVRGIPECGVLDDLREGIRLADGMAALSGAEVLERVENRSDPAARLRVHLREGRNREVRRMMATVGHPVISLCRVRLGDVALGELPPGRWRHLTEEEVRSFP